MRRKTILLLGGALLLAAGAMVAMDRALRPAEPESDPVAAQGMPAAPGVGAAAGTAVAPAPSAGAESQAAVESAPALPAAQPQYLDPPISRRGEQVTAASGMTSVPDPRGDALQAARQQRFESSMDWLNRNQARKKAALDALKAASKAKAAAEKSAAGR